MSELRGTPKASRTVAIVVLVVFFQVLVVAVLGLGAIRQDRKSSRERGRQEAERTARKVVEQIKGEVLEAVREGIDKARNIATAAHLAALESRSGELVQEIYLLDQDGTVRWIDGDTRLYVPPEVRNQAIRRMDLARAAGKREDVDKLSTSRDKPQTGIEGRQRHLRAFPYDWMPGPPPFSYALNYADELVGLAAQVYAQSEDGLVERDQLLSSLLLALEVATLNKGRPGLEAFDQESIVELEAKIKEQARLLGHAGHPALEATVRRWLRYRDRLADGSLHERLLSARINATANPGSRVFMTAIGAERYAVVPDETTGHRVMRLDPDGLAAIAREKVRLRAGNELSRAGFRVRVLGKGEAVADTAFVQREAVTQGGIDTPIVLGLVRVGSPLLPEEGRSELFYWGIIALAAVGFTVGGIVLVRMTAREIRLARLKADFASNLSHELKTPLTSIAMFTEMLKEGQLSEEDDRQEAYQILDQEATRLQGIVQRMLQVARHQARGVPFAKGFGDLNETVQRATERFRRIVTEPGLHLDVELAPEPLTMQLDPAAMDDVITNLLSNAWKYKRGEEARVRVVTSRRGRQGELRVIDDGIGIPPRERRRVFEMFYRSNQLLTQPVPGTGLGLSLVQNVVRAHKGTVRVAPTEGGEGSTFILRFPLSERRAAAPAKPDIERLAADEIRAAAERRPEGVDL